MNISKKLLLSLLLGFGLFTSAFGDDSKALIIKLRSGSSTTFVLSEKPIVSFSDHVLIVSVGDRKTSFEISNVSQFYFDKAPSSVEPIAADNLRMTYHSNDKVIIEGLNEQDHVRLHSLGGIQYADRITIVDNRVEVSLEALPIGTYIISIPNKQTFKVQRK